MYLFSSVINILQSALRCQRKRCVHLKVKKNQDEDSEKAERRRYVICLVQAVKELNKSMFVNCVWTLNCDDCNDIANNEGIPIT